MSFGWFQQDQSANRSAQDTCRGLDLCRPCQPITASEQLHDYPFAREQSWEFRFLFQLSCAKTSIDSHDPELI
ncbi:hypothetical protein T07_5213 [Trichinella nelsoni]|uniref:Uncharacterized protein n=1 Tax=Trichinella nelsoni TaxID=6336 RepID=A0A0V0RNA9_9BILA|nr:hypothetical protein T07_5213 [Trichinella nelsoni]